MIFCKRGRLNWKTVTNRACKPLYQEPSEKSSLVICILEISFNVKTASTCTTELWDARKSFILTRLKIKVAPYPVIVSLDTLNVIGKCTTVFCATSSECARHQKFWWSWHVCRVIDKIGTRVKIIKVSMTGTLEHSLLALLVLVAHNTVVLSTAPSPCCGKGTRCLPLARPLRRKLCQTVGHRPGVHIGFPSQSALS